MPLGRWVESSSTSGDVEGWPGRPQRDSSRLDRAVQSVNIEEMIEELMSYDTAGRIAECVEGMNAIYNGRCLFVVSREGDAVWLETHRERARRTLVSVGHPDLILNPSEEDLDLAEAFERGEVNAFEYPDGHTFPPGREIATAKRTQRVRRFARH